MRFGALERAAIRSLLEEKCRALALDDQHLAELRETAGLTDKPHLLARENGGAK